MCLHQYVLMQIQMHVWTYIPISWLGKANNFYIYIHVFKLRKYLARKVLRDAITIISFRFLSHFDHVAFWCTCKLRYCCYSDSHEFAVPSCSSYESGGSKFFSDVQTKIFCSTIELLLVNGDVKHQFLFKFFSIQI